MAGEALGLRLHRAEAGPGEAAKSVVAVAHRRNDTAHGRCDHRTCVGNADGVTREIAGEDCARCVVGRLPQSSDLSLLIASNKKARQ